MIPVTKSFLPPAEEYQAVLKRAWDAGWITNRGELVIELENLLRHYLGLEYMTLTTNGTIPLQLAIKAMGLKGEIITTPFSYVATTSAIVWENCTPVFVDIHPEYLTIDEAKIEAAITPKTSAILATHVFGNPCDVDAISRIAEKHNLKVIYDGAHAFGVNYKGKSVLTYGDVVTCSFHATKIFHTGEGGAMICNNQALHDTLFYHHNFGHNGPLEFHGLGINAKMSELQAAMGLVVFRHLPEIFEARKKITTAYDRLLSGKKLQRLSIRPEAEWNYSYYPVLFESEKQLLEITAELNANDIFPRRYFYPSLNTLPYLTEKKSCPHSETVSRTVLSLPLYHSLDMETVEKVSGIIAKHTG